MRLQIGAHNAGDGADKIGSLDVGLAMVAEQQGQADDSCFQAKISARVSDARMVAKILVKVTQYGIHEVNNTNIG